MSLLDIDNKLKRVVDCILENDSLDYYISGENEDGTYLQIMIDTPIEKDKKFKFGYLLRKVDGIWYITWNGTSAYWYFAQEYNVDYHTQDIVETLNLSEKAKSYNGTVSDFLYDFVKDSYACHYCHAIIPKKYIKKVGNGYSCPLCNVISNLPFTEDDYKTIINKPVVIEVMEEQESESEKSLTQQSKESERPLMQQKRYLDISPKYCSCGNLLHENTYNYYCDDCDKYYKPLIDKAIYYDDNANIYVKGQKFGISTNFDVLLPWDKSYMPSISKREYEDYYFQAALIIACRLALNGRDTKLIDAYYVESTSETFKKGFYIDITEQGKPKHFFIPYKLGKIFDLDHSHYDKSLETNRKKLQIPEQYR